MLRRSLGLVALLLFAVPAAVALAAGATQPATTPTGTATTPTGTATTPTPTPAPKQAHGSLKLYMFDAFFVSHQPVTVAGRGLHVDGFVRPYVPGQWVTVKAYLGRRLIKRDRLRVKPSKHHTYGRFTERIVSPGVGGVTVKVSHPATTTQSAFAAHRSFSALDTRISFGSTGRFVVLVQQRLAALHFYIPQTGVYDSGTGLALNAYHRLLHWGHSPYLDARTISFLLNGWGAFKVRFTRQGRHAEGNLGLQLLALIDGSNVQYIFPISSGKPSTPTILGSFQIYSRVPGYLPDGMYFSSFFTGGYAIHGYDPAPDYPASHGCIRLPIQDAIAAYNWLTFGAWVDTYY